jgi:hypothetical protein
VTPLAIRKQNLTKQTAAATSGRGLLRQRPIRPPGYRQLLGAFVRRVFSPGHFRMPSSHRRDSLILDAAVALRAGQSDRAYELLTAYDRVLTADPAYLNLLGVIFEIREDLATARRFYCLANCVDADYLPARQNARRIYELLTFGSTALAISLGDAELRAHRALPLVAQGEC